MWLSELVRQYYRFVFNWKHQTEDTGKTIADGSDQICQVASPEGWRKALINEFLLMLFNRQLGAIV
jgi:hypothetical protein